MVGPFRGVDRYVGPGAYVRELPAFGGLTLSSTIRNVTFIGKAQTQLPKLNEIKQRSLTSNLDSLDITGALEVTSVGDFIDVENYIQHQPYTQFATTQGSGILQTKISLTLSDKNVVEEEYEIECVIAGAPGKYTVKSLSTGFTSPLLDTSEIYGNEQIPGFVLLVRNTTGCLAGDKVRIKVSGLRTDGDFLLTENSELDWSLSSRHPEFQASVSPVVQISNQTLITQRAVSVNAGNPFIGTGLLSSQVIPYNFNPVAVDSATYKLIVVTPRDVSIPQAGTYRVVKIKNNQQINMVGIDLISKQVTSVFTNGESYVLDGLTFNFIIESGSLSTNFEAGFFVTKAGLFSTPTNGVNELGLVNEFLAIPRMGSRTDSLDAKFRIRNSGELTKGSYTMEVRSAAGPFSSEFEVGTAMNRTLLPGLDFRLADTRLRTATGVSDSANMILNSAFDHGGDNPTNWALFGSTVTSQAITDPQYGTTYSCPGKPGRKLVLQPKQLAATDRAVGTLIKLTDPIETIGGESIVMSATVKTNGNSINVLGTGLAIQLDWYDSTGTFLSSASTVYDLAGVTTSWSRQTTLLASLGSPVIPQGAVSGRITLTNTTDISDNVQIELTALQLEIGATASTYKESDMLLFRTSERKVPIRPITNLSELEYSGPYTILDSNLEITLLPGNATVSDEWYIRAIATDQVEVIRRSTGSSNIVDLGVDSENDAIPGVLVKLVSPISSEGLNDAYVVRTQAAFNRTGTITPPIYYCSYIYRRPEEEYYTIKNYLTQPDAEKDLGQPIPEYSASLAAQLAFNEGATLVRVVLLDDENDWSRALTEIEGIQTNYIVPLITMDMIPDGDGSQNPTEQQYINTVALGNQFKSHALKMSSILQRRPRTVWLSNLRGRTVEGMQFDAQNLKCDRVIYVGPTECTKVFRNSETLADEVYRLDGCFIAAAVVGKRLGLPDVATVLTRQTIGGFRSIGQRRYLEIEKDILGGSGVMLVEDSGGVFRIRHGVTTDGTNYLTQEQTVRDIADYVSYSIRETLEAQFVGRKFTGEVLSGMNTVSTQLLTSFVSGEIIEAYTGLSIQRDPIEPRTVNVTFKIAPILPINWILVEFQLTRA